MPKLKREIFLRPTRFTHRFGERDDPLMTGSEQTFEFKGPVGVKTSNGPAPSPFSIKDKGVSVYTEPFSPVDKFKGGKASLSGPRQDNADRVAETVPASTRERRTAGPAAEPAAKARKGAK